MPTLPRSFENFRAELKAEILEHGVQKSIPAGTEILREGQYLTVVPFVLNGLLKVHKQHEDKDLLLYYIQKGESCIMTFSSNLKNEPSKVVAVAEQDTELLLLPNEKVSYWMKNFPEFSLVFFDLYNLRYTDFIDTLDHVIFDKMDKRLLDYLIEKSSLTKNNPIKIAHRQIASELGTAREVVSRIIKKLESDGRVLQVKEGIKIL